METLIRSGPKGDLGQSLQTLRHLTLCDGIDADTDGMSHCRIYVWLIFLNVKPLATNDYLALTRRGPSPAHAKITNDTFRTFKTNPLFKRRVTDNSLIRLLNAVAWRLHDAKRGQCQTPAPKVKKVSPPSTTNRSTDRGSPELWMNPDDTHDTAPPYPSPSPLPSLGPATSNHSDPPKLPQNIYVQGMNVLCAPFLYVARSESEAFKAFYCFITRECPGYVRGAMDGVHRGVALVDRCLAIVDPKLSIYLLQKGARAEVYAFASVLTLCASTPPLPEVLHLWDFLLAYGIHLNILCICAQLMMMREDLLAEQSPGRLLRNFPALDAKKVIMLCVGLVPRIPDELYSELVYHAQ